MGRISFRFRKIGILVTGMVLLSLLSGCGKKDTDVVQDTRTTIRFSWWGNDVRHIYTMKGVGDFMRDNPDIEVDMSYGFWQGYENKQEVYMQSRTEADVMQINYDWIAKYSPDGTGFYDLYDLSDYIDLGTYDTDQLSFGIVNGHLNAVPTAFNTMTVYYNRAIFDAMGLEIPETWEDLRRAGRKMKDTEQYVLGISTKQAFLLMLTYFEQKEGKPFFRKDGSLAASRVEIEDLFAFYRNCIRDHVLKPIDSYSQSDYLSGKVAGTVAWVSNAGEYMDGLKANGGDPVIGEYIRMQPDDPLTGWYIKPATMYAISGRTLHPEESARLLDFLVNSKDMAELQKTEKGVPASSKALQVLEDEGEIDTSEYKANQKMESEQDAMQIMIPIMEDDEITSAFKKYTDVYLYDGGDVSETAAAFAAEASRIGKEK